MIGVKDDFIVTIPKITEKVTMMIFLNMTYDFEKKNEKLCQSIFANTY
jgi:hypothetical protein